MTGRLIEIAVDFWEILGDMSPYLLFGFLIAGLLSVWISRETVERHIGGAGIGPIFKSSLFGIPLPLCSCGVVPVGMGLRRQGASRGASTAFLISTPQTGVDSIMITISLLSPLFAVVKAVAALVTGVIGGAVVEKITRGADAGPDATEDSVPGTAIAAGHGHHEHEDIQDGDCGDSCCPPLPEQGMEHGWFRRAMSYGFSVLPRDIGKYLFVGLVISALISALVPADYFAEYLSSGVAPMLLMIVIGIPMYVCSTASVPVAAALIMAGFSPGAALVFLMTGPATNAATITTIWNVLGSRTAVAYLATISAGAIAGGLLLDAFSAGTIAGAAAASTFELPPLVKHLSAVALIAVLAAAFLPAHSNSACSCGDNTCTC